MPFCQYCGSQLGETDKFCCTCGKPVMAHHPIGNNINPGQNNNQNNFNPHPGNPPVYSQPVGMQSQPMHHGYSQQPMQQGDPHQNFQPNIQGGNNPILQTNGSQYTPNEVNYFTTPPTDDFHRKVWEYAKNRGWIDREQSGIEDLMLCINGEYFIYPILTTGGKPSTNFVLIKAITEFKEKHSDQIIQLILMEAVSNYLSRLSIESQQMGWMKSLNVVSLICLFPKELITDVSLAFDIALKDMKEVEDAFMIDYNQIINQ